MAYDILIIDDEADIRTIVSGILSDEGFETRQAEDGHQGIDLIRQRRPNLVILDIWLGDSRSDGIKILELIKQETPELPVLMMSGHGTVEAAVASIKRGAYDFVEKPFKAERLLILVRRAIEAAALKDEVTELRQRSAKDDVLIGASSSANAMRHHIEKIAPTNSRVLICGPTGAGKALMARLIHSGSRQGEGRFVVASCIGADATSFDKMLYGEENNGERLSTGLWEQAHGGTLYLDEIADIPFVSQGKLVRVLHEQAFTRYGGSRKVFSNVRIIASTVHDCQKLVESGQLREDLLYRLNVISAEVSPLYARAEDIPHLAVHFLQKLSEIHGMSPPVLSQEAIVAMKQYQWPGNVRQLRNVMEWILIMQATSEKEEVKLEHLPAEIAQRTSAVVSWDHAILTLPLREARELFEKEYMVAQLARFSGNISQTATFIGMERSALHRKLRLLSVPSLSNGMKRVKVS